jgi:hypothetical protein
MGTSSLPPKNPPTNIHMTTFIFALQKNPQLSNRANSLPGQRLYALGEEGELPLESTLYRTLLWVMQHRSMRT